MDDPSLQPVFYQFKPFCASKVFKFQDPDTGYMHYAADKPSLLKSIVSYRALNQKPPIEYLDRVLDNYLAGLPENAGEVEPIRLPRGFLTTIRGGISLLEFVLFPDEHVVDQTTAEDRAAQCVRCPKNVFPDKGLFIRWTDWMATLMIGDTRRTVQHELLGNCSVCSCILRASVWYKGDHKLTPEQKKEAKTVNCWKLKE